MRKRNENLKQIILAEGKKLLLEKNYKTFSMREIAKSCDIALGTFYTYFAGKEQLAHEIVENDWKNTSKLINEVLQSNEQLEYKLSRIYDIVEAFLKEYMTVFFEVMLQYKHKCPDRFYIDLIKQVTQLVAKHKANGSITNTLDDEKMARFIITSFFYNIKNQTLTFGELYRCFKFD